MTNYSHRLSEHFNELWVIITFM